MRPTGFGAFTVQQRVIHIECSGPTRLQQLERLAVIPGTDDGHTEFMFEVVTLEKALVGGTGGGHHILATQVGKILNTAGPGGQQLAFHINKTVGKCYLLLPLHRHACRTAFQVYSAILHQRYAGLGGHKVVFHLEFRQRQMLLNACNYFACQVH
ncbi:hypothetical protein D9M73_235880 [compost metagenome]